MRLKVYIECDGKSFFLRDASSDMHMSGCFDTMEGPSALAGRKNYEIVGTVGIRSHVRTSIGAL